MSSTPFLPLAERYLISKRICIFRSQSGKYRYEILVSTLLPQAGVNESQVKQQTGAFTEVTY